jgi:large subunit ribosomal protein L4e
MAEKKARKIKAEKEEGDTEAKLTPGKLFVYDLEGKVTGEQALPAAFKHDLRTDIIRRAVTAIESNARQPYAPSPTAGMRHSVSTWGKGRGVSRVQRLMDSSTAAQSPNNVGGRRAHPPKVEKDLGKKIDEKLTVPVVVKDDFETIATTKEAVKALSSLGVYEDVERALAGRNIRAGRGKMRGRRHRSPKSLLVVLSKECEGGRSVRNLPGVDVVTPNALNASVLAPGGDPGRLMLISEAALQAIGGWAR